MALAHGDFIATSTFTQHLLTNYVPLLPNWTQLCQCSCHQSRPGPSLRRECAQQCTTSLLRSAIAFNKTDNINLQCWHMSNALTFKQVRQNVLLWFLVYASSIRWKWVLLRLQLIYLHLDRMRTCSNLLVGLFPAWRVTLLHQCQTLLKGNDDTPLFLPNSRQLNVFTRISSPLSLGQKQLNLLLKPCFVDLVAAFLPTPASNLNDPFQ